MKAILFTVLISTSVWGRTPFRETLPETIVCRSKAISQVVREFKITALNTSSPDTTLPDTSLMEAPIMNGVFYNVGFSNECDNSYDLTLTFKDLIALKKGTVNSITGTLEYFDVALQEEEHEEDETRGAGEALIVTCSLN